MENFEGAKNTIMRASQIIVFLFFMERLITTIN